MRSHPHQGAPEQVPANPRRLAALAAALCTVVFAALPSSASAGTYTMRSCNVPGQPPAPAGPWTSQNTVGMTTFDDCAAGGGFGLTFPAQRVMRHHAQAELRLHRPIDGPKHAIGIKQARLWLFARLGGSGAPAFVFFNSNREGSSPRRTELFGPPGGNTLDGGFATPVYEDDTPYLDTVLYCSSGAPGDCALDDGRPLEIRGAEVTLAEGVLPSGAIDGETLTTGQAQNGVKSLSYTGTDRESGVQLVEVLLGDRVVARRDFSSDRQRCRYSSWNACQETISEDVAVDTAAAPDGDHPLTLRITDAAANRAVVQGGVIRVQNHRSPTSSSSTPVVRFTNSDSTLLRTYRRVRYGKHLTLRSVLRDANGRPIPNARVDVLLRRAVGATTFRVVRRVTTDSRGVLRYTVPSGPSRVVRFAYRGAVDAGSYAFTHDVRVAVTAAATLKLDRPQLRNGQRLRFSGGLRGVKTPKVVEVQVMQRGRWQTIASVRTRGSGRFSWSYRFTRTFRPTKYTFRVRVRTERGFPYATGYSPKRSVRVS